MSSEVELLRFLDNISHMPNSGRWYFRGQANSAWGLLPTTFRTPGLEDSATAKKFERYLLARLKEVMSNRSAVPQRLIEDPSFLFALARHYGAPTRVLDWSKSPHVAAYFAAVPAPTETGALPEAISVFALAEIAEISNAFGITCHVPATAANPNLEAQRGVLWEHSWEKPDLWDKAREHIVAVEPFRVTADLDDRLIRVDLPQKFAPKLRSRLFSLGVDATTLFPGPQGLVAFGVEQAWDWLHQARGET